MPLDSIGFEADTPILTELMHARDRLLERGWCQHMLTDKDWHVCAIGAFDSLWFTPTRVFDGLASALPLEWRLAEVASQRGSAPAIVAYNNAPGRTMDEIVALFDRAIDMTVERGMLLAECV